MALQNNLTNKPKFNDVTIEYDSNGTQVKLSPSIVRNYLVNGNGAVSDQEVVMFLNLCKAQRLNPFLREAYLVKYGSSEATIVTGKEVFTKRARRNKNFSGQQAGVIVLKDGGEIESRIGTLVLDGETLVGGWAKIFIKGDDIPTEMTVSFNEYVGRKSDGTVNAQWAKKPATMIRKVALVQALREAFPEEFQGMYAQEETDMSDALVPDVPVSIPEPAAQPQLPEPPAESEIDPFA